MCYWQFPATVSCVGKYEIRFLETRGFVNQQGARGTKGTEGMEGYKICPEKE